MTTMLHAEYEARKSVWSDIQQHLPALYATVAAYDKPVVVELGVRWAVSTSALLAGTEAAGGHLWSVDITAPSYPSWWHDTGYWTLTVGNDTDAAVMAKLPAECDVLFIDTVHTYEHTLNELRLWVPRVKPGGTVLLHDTELSSSEFRGRYGSQPDNPVAAALDTYAAESGITWTNTTGCYGLGTIHIGNEGGENAS